MTPSDGSWNPRRGFRDSGDGREGPTGRRAEEGPGQGPDPVVPSGRRRGFGPPGRSFSEEFSGDRQGALFSPEQLRRLLLGEIDRASRQRYPLGCLRVAVDRLDSLQDIYGLDSRREISGSLLSFLGRDLRGSDFVGQLTDGSVLVLLPHISPGSLKAICQRLLRGVRKLVFESGRKRIHVTLSIGVGYSRGEDRASLHQIYDLAQAGMERALQLGGDRVVEPEPNSPGLAAPKSPSAERTEAGVAAPARAPVAPPAPAPLAPAAAALDPELLLRTVRQAIAEHQTTLNRLAETRSQPAGPDNRQLDLLERRVAKLAAELERYQDELQRISGPGPADEGIRSLGKVPGQDRSKDKARMSLMGEIFKANVALREALLASARIVDPARPADSLG